MHTYSCMTIYLFKNFNLVFIHSIFVGIWPSDYTLSDHGMVEVVFKVSALAQEIIVNSKHLENVAFLAAQNN
jgi:hypothetical protein